MTIAISPPAGYSTSPHRSSPLSAPPLQAGHAHSSHKIAIPRKASHHAHSPSSPLSQASPGHPHISPHRASPSHSPSSSPLSRSHPLLGSYPLSLLHARMATHRSHCASQFALRVRAIATGPAYSSSGPRAPSPLVLPFRATYYDLVGEEEPCIGGPSHSPWVADVDLEAHYFAQYTGVGGEGKEGKDEPPAYPGYRVPGVGQLQILIKTATAAVHAFVLPYDLSSLEPGARLLARECTYVSSPPLPSKEKVEKDKDKEKGESLRYAVQLQFACVPDTSTDEVSYYLARTLKVVFTSSPPDSGAEQRTERADEVVPPSSPTPSGRRESSLRKSITSMSPLAPRNASGGTAPLPSPSPPSKRRSSIEASTEWATVRAQWRMRAANAAAIARGFEPLESRPVSPVPVAPSPRSLLSALAPEEERERRPQLERTQSGQSEKQEGGSEDGKRESTENGHPQRPASSRTPSVASARSRRRLSREERELSARLRASNLGD